MPIIVNLDVMMAKRKISLNELSERVGLTLSNLSILKTGKAKAIRFSTLEAICRALDCSYSSDYGEDFQCCRLFLHGKVLLPNSLSTVRWKNPHRYWLYCLL